MQFRPTENAQTSHMEQNFNRKVPNQDTKPYWLQLDYLASILQQNEEKVEFPSNPTIIINPAVPSNSQQVSTSCGPRGCTATSGNYGI